VSNTRRPKGLVQKSSRKGFVTVEALDTKGNLLPCLCGCGSPFMIDIPAHILTDYMSGKVLLGAAVIAEREAAA
jgi:hypothetical protein